MQNLLESGQDFVSCISGLVEEDDKGVGGVPRGEIAGVTIDPLQGSGFHRLALMFRQQGVIGLKEVEKPQHCTGRDPVLSGKTASFLKG